MPPRSHADRKYLPLVSLGLCALSTALLWPGGPQPPGRMEGPDPKSHPIRSEVEPDIGAEESWSTSGAHVPGPWSCRPTFPAIPWKALDAVAAGESKTLEFTLRGGTQPVSAEVVKAEVRSKSSFTLIGRLRGRDHDGSWSLSRKGEIVVANFRLPDGGPSLEWRLNSDGTPVERELVEELLPPCETGTEDIPAFADEPGPARARAEAPDSTRVTPRALPGQDGTPAGPEIAVLVVYTPAAVAAVGGPVAMEALVYLALDETNAALADSLAIPRLRLVHHQEVNYAETGDELSTDLSRLRNPSDGYLDEVEGLRDMVGADLVSLIAVNQESCGRAYTLVADAASFHDFAFSVVAQDCVATNYSFSHEIAHNLGCQHAVGDDNGTVMSGNGIFPYSHGWRFNAASADGTQYRTIMAQSPGFRVPFFSNPNILVAGAVAGSAETGDCVRTLNMTAPTAIGWRNTPDTLYGDALEQPDWIFQTGGDAPWTVQPIERQEGVDALQVGFVPDNGSSWLQTMRSGPVQIDFVWKVRIDDPVAALAVTVDGVEYGRIAGTTGWRRQMVRIPVGSHVVRWTQVRGNTSDAMDALGWVDSVRVSPVPLAIHAFHALGQPVEEIDCRFESIPFQDYVLEFTADFVEWRPIHPVTPTDPAARDTSVQFNFPSPTTNGTPESAAFRIRMLE